MKNKHKKKRIKLLNVEKVSPDTDKYHLHLEVEGAPEPPEPIETFSEPVVIHEDPVDETSIAPTTESGFVSWFKGLFN
jgi:hypothetical protein